MTVYHFPLMRRRRSTFLPALSMLLCGVVITLWLTSYVDLVYSHAGRVLLIKAESDAIAGFLWDQQQHRGVLVTFHMERQRRDPALWDQLRRAGTDAHSWERAGFEYHAGMFPTDGKMAPYQLVAVPYWAILSLPLLVAMLPAAAVAARSFRRRRHRGRSLCPTCGYDLRATPGRCPECGVTAK